MFNSENFNEIEYLNFDDNFVINVGSKIKIILGPNGTCKSSLCRNIISRHKDYAFIDYEDVKESVVAKKNTIVIGASILKLDNKIKERQQLIDSVDIKGNLKSFGITNKATSKKISDNLETLRMNQFLAIKQFKSNNLDVIFNLNEDYRDFFNNNAKEIINIKEIKTSIDDIKNSLKRHILSELDNYLDDDDFVCPVCGAINNEPVKDIINKKILELKSLDDEIVKAYQEKHIDMEPEKVLENINELKKIIADNNISMENFENYLLCGGDKNNSNTILKVQKDLNKLDKEINILQQKKEEFYRTLENNKEELNSIFQLQLDVKNGSITYDSNAKEIIINLPRKIEEYSTGEINLITFITCILEFISSDKKILVIDDPLSSYDIPNQYRIIYEIVTAKCENKSKNMLIFTHNINTINIANTQYNLLFEYEVIEKTKGILYLNKIDFSSNKSILSIDELKENISPSYKYASYIKLLEKKETWDNKEESHLIFHYDEPFSKVIDGVEYTNDYLVKLIDDFNDSTFKNVSYVENTANKIIYTAALRVWIEKQFYNNSKNDSALHKKQLGEKIKYIFTNNRWKGSNQVTRKYLMSKKVMLNQHLHINSQEIPFYYVLNLTLDDIEKEIKDIKQHFKG